MFIINPMCDGDIIRYYLHFMKLTLLVAGKSGNKLTQDVIDIY